MSAIHVPTTKFNPLDPARTIKVKGQFNGKMVDKVGRRIRTLQAASILPLTLEIDSRGGNVDALDQIYKILMMKMNGKRCPIITIVYNEAASAAAHLLAIGDSVYARENALIHFHGGSAKTEERLTKEYCGAIAKVLGKTDDKLIERLIAGRVIRLYQRYVECKREIQSTKKRSMPKIKSFADVLIKKLKSDAAKSIIHGTIEKCQERKQLAEEFLPKVSGKSGAAFELALHNAILKSKLEKSRGGIIQEISEEAGDNFYLLKEFYAGSHNGFAVELMQLAAREFLPRADLNNLVSNKKTLANTARQKLFALYENDIRDLLFFAAILCVRLYSGENSLTGQDAYWLGIVDKVVPFNTDGIVVTVNKTKKGGTKKNKYPAKYNAHSTSSLWPKTTAPAWRERFYSGRRQVVQL